MAFEDDRRIQDLEGRLISAPRVQEAGSGLDDLESLAELYLRADSYVPALETLHRLLKRPELAERSDVRRLALEVKVSECLRRQGRYGDAAERSERAFAATGPGTPPEIRVRLGLERVDALTHLSRYEEAKTLARTLLKSVREIGDQELLAAALFRSGILWMRLGDWVQSRELLEEARGLFSMLGIEAQIANVENALGLLHKNLCEWALAQHYLRDALARDRRLGRFSQVATRLQNLGIVYLKSGDWSKAHDQFTEARKVFRQVGNQWGLTTTALSLGIHSRLVGRLEESRKLLEEALEGALAAGMLREEALAREFMGDLAMAESDAHRALEHYRTALTLAERTAPAGDIVSEVLRRMAEAHIHLGELDAARAAVDRCREICNLLEDRFEGAVLHRVAGSLFLRQGEREEALREFRTAVNLLSEMGERFERGRALFLLAQNDADRGSARKAAYRASACFAEMGAEDWLADVEEWLAEGIAERTGSAKPTGRRQRLFARRKAESHGMVGISRGLARALDLVERAAATDLTTIITGPSGTGKELVARAIHERSGRRDRPFLPVNCGALRAELALSQLFGHRRGSFTGAHADGTGLVEAAHTGTLFLDEVGELPLDVQVTLLRFLERGDYIRIGDTSIRHADVRIVAATHVDLRQAVAESRFRTDLFYRLNEIEIVLPPLVDRMEDVLPLTHHFLRLYSGEPEPGITPEAANVLTAYKWPGNVRELENCVRRVLALRDETNEPIRADELVPHLGQLELGEMQRLRAPAERDEVLSALTRAGGNKSAAAAYLGVSRKTLYARMRRLGISLQGDE
jgi:DNA-binding NtrC family response regulator/tetratricopeptide (TPR) repeat protein